jgi:ABC-type multidrug transport system fused ATPase/permease subunit
LVRVLHQSLSPCSCPPAAENIRYGAPDASDEQVEAAARAANAHSFIARLPEQYHTKVGAVQVSMIQKGARR